jgi:hypothetical protein
MFDLGRSDTAKGKRNEEVLHAGEVLISFLKLPEWDI